MILVTGGTGFLGSELIKQLLKGEEKVRATKRAGSVIPALLQNKPIEWVDADLSDYYALEEALEDISKVYHCAGFISMEPADHKKLQKINAEGTANIVNLCLEKNIKKLLHVSSVAALGKATDNKLITENDHWLNDHQYGYSISKYAAEMEVWRGIAESLNAVIVNPSIIIGKNAGIPGSGEFFEIVRKGLKFYTSGSCGFVDVEDVAAVMIHLMESDIQAERFIINSENYSYYKFLEQIALQYGLKPPTRQAKPWMLGLAWRIINIFALFTGKRYGITKYTAYNALEKQEFSNEKIINATGIKFKPVSQSIAEICSSLNP
jgi:nucleoside-diphosphate-sugar epimerase